jgi:Putative DNA-binding domain
VTRGIQKKNPIDGPLSSAASVSPPLTLSEIQALFQAAILENDKRVLGLLLDNSMTTRETLFGVYQNGYVSRLVEILGSDYEDLRAYLGEDAFDELAQAYVAAKPSQSQNARWFGNQMPAFLAADERYSSRRELTDLAQIERALSLAFDAADAPQITLKNLADHKPEDWGRLTFVPHPSVTAFDLTTNAFSIWRAIKNEKPVPKSKTIVGQRLVTWRQGVTPMIREMQAEEAMMWLEACRGARFEVLCEMIATFAKPDEAAVRAATYLQGWLASEMLTSANLASEGPAGPKTRTRVSA